jgi:hypothetical protein
MSYYNEMYIPIESDEFEDQAELLYFTEDEEGFDNMIQLMNLPTNLLKTKPEGSSYIILKHVSGAAETMRPKDLDWNWHTRKCYYGDPDCFIFVNDMHSRIDWCKIGSQEEYTRMEELVALYQSKLKEHGEHLFIYPM